MPRKNFFWRRLVDNLKLGGRMMPTIDGETSLRVRKKQKGNDSGTCQALMPKRQDFLRSGLEGTRRLLTVLSRIWLLCVRFILTRVRSFCRHADLQSDRDCLYVLTSYMRAANRGSDCRRRLSSDFWWGPDVPLIIYTGRTPRSPHLRVWRFFYWCSHPKGAWACGP